MIQTPKITPAKKKILESLGILNGRDILFHYPYRYERFEQIPFRDWKAGDTVICTGTLAAPARNLHIRGRLTLTRMSIITSDSVTLELAIFNQPWVRNWPEGSAVTAIGRYDGRQKITVTKAAQNPIGEYLGIHPVYSLKEGLTSKYFQELALAAYRLNADQIADAVPEEFRLRYGLMTAPEALYELHAPGARLEQAIRTMKYQEFLKFQLVIQYRRRYYHQTAQGSAKRFSEAAVWEKARSFPYELTGDQEAAVRDILADLASEQTMYRLVEGDVGSGKTSVAALAMYAAALSGQQSVLLAPTEILARQHEQTLRRFFAGTGYAGAALYSALEPAARRQILAGLKSGELAYAVGTHALFQDDVEFGSLGLIITDEQQRFGVAQRQRMAAKGRKVDVLMMSATPIPRTLASSLYGDMDVSVIAAMPAGRRPIETRVIPENSIRSVKKDLEALMDSGDQVYIIAPSIEDGAETKTRNVTDLYHNLQKEWAGRYRVGYLHGRMTSAEKEAVMEGFSRHQLDVLISTTVVEVGVDVPDANVMVIYDAQQFGLSQIHQLRGRIGRHGGQGRCYLLASGRDPEVRERLDFLAGHSDGFEIAAYDLERRGPGDLLGSRQSGAPGFILGDLATDGSVLAQAGRDAAAIISQPGRYPEAEAYLRGEGERYLHNLD